VPVFYGDSSRQVASIIANNSENTMPTVPAMAVYIHELKYRRQDVQEPYYVSKVHLRQRKFNPDTNSYDNHMEGNTFTVERLMPVPYMLGLKLDIWTSNKDQKLQLLEQIAVLFNPSMEIQNTDNWIDWTSLSVVTLMDVSWSNRSVPIGTDDPIDIATLTFEIPIWLTPPAKVKKMGVIHKIIESLFESDGSLSDAISNDSYLIESRQYYTPLNYELLYVGNELTLLRIEDIVVEPPMDSTADPEKIGTPEKWINLVNLYGTLVNGISQVRLTMENGDEIVGTIAYHPTDDTKMLFTPDIDTLPTNTLDPINAIIDPQRVVVDSNILNPAAGTRYLILSAIGDDSDTEQAIAWDGIDDTELIANANDIIEYNGSHWIVSFDSQGNSDIEYVSNLTTGVQYKWREGQWVKSYEGFYDRGNWTLVV
jgi:hypothetical protein